MLGIPTMVRNPWTSLPTCAEYVLPEDKPYIDAFNHSQVNRADRWVNLAHPPEPRLGPVDAPVLLLQLNPSYSSKEFGGPRDASRLAVDLANIRDESTPHLGV